VVADFENLSYEAIPAGGSQWQQLNVRLADNIEEVYALVCAILDRVQLAGEEFGEAVESTIASLTGILAVRQGLSRERQIGLFGELLVLLTLTCNRGESAALGSWRGPLGEEHDFGLEEADVEVKTTLGERREHWIGSAQQLSRTGNRQLYLLSIQLTTAALARGWTLPGLVEVVRNKLQSVTAQVNAMLTSVGYRDRDADLYRSRWTLRTRPGFFEVDDQFPAITDERIGPLVNSYDRIREIRYRIDLTGIPLAVPLFGFDAVTSLEAHSDGF
jgi:hypothetical protein